MTTTTVWYPTWVFYRYAGNAGSSATIWGTTSGTAANQSQWYQVYWQPPNQSDATPRVFSTAEWISIHAGAEPYISLSQLLDMAGQLNPALTQVFTQEFLWGRKTSEVLDYVEFVIGLMDNPGRADRLLLAILADVVHRRFLGDWWWGTVILTNFAEYVPLLRQTEDEG